MRLPLQTSRRSLSTALPLDPDKWPAIATAEKTYLAAQIAAKGLQPSGEIHWEQVQDSEASFKGESTFEFSLADTRPTSP